MNNALKNLIAVGLLLTVFAPSAFAQQNQQVQFTLVQVKAGKMQTPVDGTELVTQEYRVQVPYTENVKQSYTIEVPYTEKQKQTYEVEIPYTETVVGDDGKEKKVQNTRIEKRDRMVAVQKTRTKTKTRMVPVQRVRTETRTRQVRVKWPRNAVKMIQFPPADAKFAFVSGKAITSDEMKDRASGSFTVLKLPAGKTLSDLQRQILRPDLIVMTMPAKADSKSEE